MMTSPKLGDRQKLVAVVFVAWSIALLVAFLLNQGPELRQLNELPALFTTGPIVGPPILHSLLGILIAALIAGAWLGLGGFLIWGLGLETAAQNRSISMAYRVAAGAAIWSLLWFFLGLVGLYNQPAAIVSIILGLALGVYAFMRLLRAGRFLKGGPTPRFAKILIVLILFPTFLAFIGSLAPPIAKDTLLYHFAVPKAFLANGNNAVIEGNIASYLALGTEMQVVWAMLIGSIFSERAGEAAAGATTFLFLPLLLLIAYGWARSAHMSRTFALTATLLVAAVPTVFHVASSGYVDLALAVFVTLAIHAMGSWWKSGENRSLVWMALFLGTALSIKLTSLFVIAAFALVILLRARTSQVGAHRHVANGFAALMVAGLIAAPWYVRTWTATGSPVFPFYMSLWKGEAPGWDVERSNLFQAINSHYGGAEKSVGDYIAAPWRLSINSRYEDPNLFDGVLGAAFLLGLPLLAVALVKRDIATEVKIGVGISGIMFLFWLSSSQQLRYLLPILPALSLGVLAAAQTVADRRSTLERSFQAGFVVLAVAAVLVSLGWFADRAPLRVVLGGESRDGYLTRNLDYYSYYQLINADHTPDAKTWLINMRRDTYHINGPVISDYMFEDWTLRQMVWESRDASELKARAAALGIKHIMTRHDFLFDYNRSTLVDDKRPRSENEAKLALAKELVLDKARTVRQDQKFSLVKLF